MQINSLSLSLFKRVVLTSQTIHCRRSFGTLCALSLIDWILFLLPQQTEMKTRKDRFNQAESFFIDFRGLPEDGERWMSGLGAFSESYKWSEQKQMHEFVVRDFQHNEW